MHCARCKAKLDEVTELLIGDDYYTLARSDRHGETDFCFDCALSFAHWWKDVPA